MIRYTLKCSDAHTFESWFKSADAFDTQRARDLVSCPICGSTEVSKAIMAPRVSTGRAKEAAVETAQIEQTPSAPPKATPDAPASEASIPAKAPETMPAPTQEQVEQAIATMRAEVEANSDYVGMEFAAEARKMHEGETPARSIYGEAKIDEAKALIEEGVPLMPLPFTPKRKMN